MRSLLSNWYLPLSNQRLNVAIWLLVCLCNGIVFYNAWWHHPLIGYDAHDHAAYLLTLANGRLPTPLDTYEFFSPPLPYLLPAAALGLGWLPPSEALRLALLLNGLLSLGVTLALVALCHHIAPRRPAVALATLALVGMMPVYYKTFAFIRGEPYVLFFSLLTLLTLLQAAQLPSNHPAQGRYALWLGLFLGLGMLSRQWAFFLLPIVGLYYLLAWWQAWPTVPSRRYRLGIVVQRKTAVLPIIRHGLKTAVISLLVGGWFYLYLYQTYGSLTTFNRDPANSFTLTNHPTTFYFGLGDGYLFRDPVRPHFADQLLPKFYSELWGDHEAYFVVMGRDWRNGRYLPGWQLEAATSQEWLTSNRTTMGQYLGWVNRIALLPTAVLTLGFLWGGWQTSRWLRRHRWQQPTAAVYLWLTITLSTIGYLWFLIQYPNPEKADTIKATYLLHIFPLLALLAALALEKSPPRLRQAVWLLLLLAAAMLAPIFFTRYPVV